MLRGWVFLAIVLFAVLPPRRAVLTAYIAGWLFLPQAGIPISGLPDLDKITATSMGALIGVILFDADRLAGFRPAWVDLPMILWCVLSVPSSLVNGLGLYDGLSGIVRDGFTWGIPYFIGRMYFNDLASLRELAVGIFIGGLAYVPLCLYEIRMSPQLHRMVYGFHPSFFGMAMRFGGYRPMVFMQHGLMVGMWMTSASLIGLWLWSSGAIKRLAGLPIGPVLLVLLITTVLCKSAGALALLALGAAAMYFTRYTRTSIMLLAVLALAPLYMTLRAQGLWSGRELVEWSASINQDRADSLLGRLENEDRLLEKELQRPLLGWGGWGRWRIYDQTGKDLTISDGLWVIALGEKGLLGLASLTAIVLLPFVLVLRRIPAQHWLHPAAAAPAALAMFLALYAIDNLFNGMVNPIYFIAAGGISGYFVLAGQPEARRRAAQTSAAQDLRRRSRFIQPNARPSTA